MKASLVVCLAVAMLAGCAKGANSGSNATASPVPSASAAAVVQNGAQASDGAKVYQANCSSCHQATGVGIEGEFPPLAGNPVVVGDPMTVIHILKYGLNGKIAVRGHQFNGMMPAWGQQLSNADIAAVITYIRSSWGNDASAVTEAEVAAVSQ